MCINDDIRSSYHIWYTLYFRWLYNSSNRNNCFEVTLNSFALLNNSFGVGYSLLILLRLFCKNFTMLSKSLDNNIRSNAHKIAKETLNNISHFAFGNPWTFPTLSRIVNLHCLRCWPRFELLRYLRWTRNIKIV